MNRAVNPERVVQAFIEEGTTALSSHVHAAIGEEIRHTRQRDRARPWRRVTMPSRVLMLWPAGVLILVVGIAVGAGVAQPQPTDMTPSVAPVVSSAPVSPKPAPSAPPSSAPASLVADGEVWLLHGTGDGRIRMVRPDGSGSREILAETGMWQFDPAWAPDGRRFAFEAGFGFASQIWVADAGADMAAPLTDLDDHCAPLCSFASDPAWSGDGQSLAYIRTDVDVSRFLRNELVVVDVATGVTRTLLSDEERILSSPSWEPRTSRIVVGIEARPRTGAATPVEARLVVIDAAAEEPVAEIVPGTAEDAMSPDWGPNGLITYVSNGMRDGQRLDPARGSALLVVDPDSGVSMVLVRNPPDGAVPVTPAWWPGGEGVVFGSISATGTVPVLRTIEVQSRAVASATGDTTTVGWAPDLRPVPPGGQ